MDFRWSSWHPFPDPRKGGILQAPLGPGVYEVRHISDKELVLVGIGKHCAARMSSLLPRPYGTGTRNNTAKCQYLMRHLDDIEYRTLRCLKRDHAADIERKLLRTRDYRFKT